MRLSIAIVEDENSDQEALKEALKKYHDNNPDVSYKIETFSVPAKFLDSYQPIYDIVFMDIKMPGYDGLETSRLLRAKDDKVTLVFITSMAQYAINGYEVAAFDFMLKPIKYTLFEKCFSKIVKLKGSVLDDKKITLKTKNGAVLIVEKDIIYIESIDHKIIYHTTKGDYETYGSIKNLLTSLKSQFFSQCHQSYVVNLNYVTSVKGYDLYLNDIVLPISHPKKPSFMEEFNAFMLERM